MLYQHRFSDDRPCELPNGKIVCVGRNYAKKRGRKPGSKVAAKAAPKAAAKKPRKKQAARPLRKFKNPKTGEITETRAPQVNKTIKAWAAESKLDWRKLEV